MIKLIYLLGIGLAAYTGEGLKTVCRTSRSGSYLAVVPRVIYRLGGSVTVLALEPMAIVI